MAIPVLNDIDLNNNKVLNASNLIEGNGTIKKIIEVTISDTYTFEQLLADSIANPDIEYHLAESNGIFTRIIAGNLQVSGELNVLETSNLYTLRYSSETLDNKDANLLINKNIIGYGKNMTNTPEAYGFLQNLSVNGSLNYNLQVFSSFGGNAGIYTRIQSNGTWGNWEPIWSNNNCPVSLAANGYQKLANGLILQWVKIDIPANEQFYSAVLPISFPNNFLCITAGYRYNYTGAVYGTSWIEGGSVYVGRNTIDAHNQPTTVFILGY